MIIPATLSFVSALVLLLSAGLPYYKHFKLHSPDTSDLTALNERFCRHVQPAGLGFCEDAVIHRPTGLAYMVCDPSRPWYDPSRGVFEEPPKSAQYDVRQGASVWVWDLKTQALPRKLDLSGLPTGGALHPTSIVVTAHPTQLNSTDPDSLTLLVANHPWARAAGVVDVFTHNLKSPSGRENAVLNHRVRLGTDQFIIDKVQFSPLRLTIFAEQFSPEYNATQPGDQAVSVPSFFFSSAAPPSIDGWTGSFQPSFLHHLKALVKPSHAARSQISVYLARGKVARAVIYGTAAHPGFAPAPVAWDGGGKRGGSNSSASSVFVMTTSTSESTIFQWDQHWVRGVQSGIEMHEDPYDANPPVISLPIPEPGDAGYAAFHARAVRTYTPSFATFFSSTQRFPVRALDVDAVGRLWAAGTPRTAEVDAWIEHLRRTLGNGLRAYERAPGQQSADSPVLRPAASISQTTYLHRAGRSIIHPWEHERLASARKQGIWLPKEFVDLPIFAHPATDASKPFEPVAVDQSDSSQRGFLPNAPTGIAVDHELQKVIVTSAWDERGVALCDMPPDWAEM